jgi:hypothetical protein
MKLSIRCRGGHTKPTVAGRDDDHAICDLINEVQMPVAVSAIRNSASRSQAALFAYSRRNDLARMEMVRQDGRGVQGHMPSRSARQFDGL